MTNLRRNLLHWYTYRTVVGVLMGLCLAVFCFWLYSGGPVPGTGASVDFAVHPEDRLFPQNDPPAPDLMVVGIDNASLDKQTGIGHFPFKRDVFAKVLDNLVAAGASTVFFDVQFSETFTADGDAAFRKSLIAASKAGVAVELAYGQDGLANGNGKVVQTGSDQIPIRDFRCADPPPVSLQAADGEYAPCKQPISELVSVTITGDSDGVVRRLPMTVEPRCHVLHPDSCPAVINTAAFVAYRDFFLGKQAGTIQLQSTPDGLKFGQAWQQPLWVDSTGQPLIAFSGGPGAVVNSGQYVSILDLYKGGSGALGKLKNKAVLVGAYNATGLHDEQLVPNGNGVPMPGVEIHSNFLTALLEQQVKFTFVRPEPWQWVLLTLLLLGVLMGFAVSRTPVTLGAAATLAALVIYTAAAFLVAPRLYIIPNLLEVWIVIALTYTGVTAYRFLYEDREKRKVTAIFSQFLKPELVQKLAAVRSMDEIMVGGERRELTLFFVDIRGFTAMSETMQAEDVLKVTHEYLTELTRLIFKWDGTVDKYVGDEIVAIWNAPHDQPEHALLAVRCAYDMISHAPELQQRLLAMNLPPIRYGIGINTGPAVVGNLGSAMRFQYTALGDTVNTAARFCGAAGPFELLIGELTYQHCKDYVAVELAPGIQLKGKSAETFRIYKVIAIRESPQAPWVQFPTEMATQTTYAHTQQYRTQQTLLAAGATVAVETSEAGAGQATAVAEPGPPENES